jgi:hypothetical protein
MNAQNSIRKQAKNLDTTAAPDGQSTSRFGSELV